MPKFILHTGNETILFDSVAAPQDTYNHIDFITAAVAGQYCIMNLADLQPALDYLEGSEAADDFAEHLHDSLMWLHTELLDILAETQDD